MHIGFVITSLVGGGAEKVVLTLAAEFSRQGHHVDLYVLTDRVNYEVDAGINVHLITSSKKVPSFLENIYYRSAEKKFRSLIAETESHHGEHDLMLFNLPEDYVLGDMLDLKNTYYCLHTAIQYALNDQKKRSNSRYRRLRKRFMALTGKNVIAVSHGVADELDKIEWLKVRSVQTIYNPFDVRLIRELSKEEVPECSEYRYIIHVGRAARLKRHDILFDALKAIPESYKLVLLSKDDEKLRRLAVKHGVQGRCVMPGFQENPYKWIKRAELTVLCSDFEGLGNVIIESLICDTPVVSTDCPYGPAEILSGNLSEWLVPVNDSKALAVKICHALDVRIDVENAPILEKVSLDYVAAQYLSLANHPGIQQK